MPADPSAALSAWPALQDCPVHTGSALLARLPELGALRVRTTVAGMTLSRTVPQLRYEQQDDIALLRGNDLVIRICLRHCPDAVVLAPEAATPGILLCGPADTVALELNPLGPPEALLQALGQLEPGPPSRRRAAAITADPAEPLEPLGATRPLPGPTAARLVQTAVAEAIPLRLTARGPGCQLRHVGRLSEDGTTLASALYWQADRWPDAMLVRRATDVGLRQALQWRDPLGAVVLQLEDDPRTAPAASRRWRHHCAAMLLAAPGRG